MLRRVVIQNYKVFENFTMEFNNTFNVLVGDNEAGKSTILEAIHLALTRRLNGRQLESEMTPHLFNKRVALAYAAALARGKCELPTIAIEVYLDDLPAFAALRGSMNSLKEDSVGVKLEIEFDGDYADDYQEFAKAQAKDVSGVPIEYYRVRWRSFANNEITTRGTPLRVSYIDAAAIRLQSGADYYLQDIIRTSLDSKERVSLALAHRRLKELFSSEQAIKEINQKLTQSKGIISDKELDLGIDLSQRTSWDTNLVPHLDDIPFPLIGRGEQSAIKIMLALERKAGSSDLILVEEPENHLSFSSMNVLLARMRGKCDGKQMIVTTHSAYVLNKLGLKNLLLLRNAVALSLAALSNDTQEYFEKLSGYDTLRLVLAKRAILVEGPSDELIVQKAYLDTHGKLPIEFGVDVISVGLSFLRFLEIAAPLGVEVRVVTDNDGDAAAVDAKYATYAGSANIKVCRSNDNSNPTLEPQLIKANGLAFLNQIFGKTFTDEAGLATYMKDRKTDCALKLFGTQGLQYPDYILSAVAEQ